MGDGAGWESWPEAGKSIGVGESEEGWRRIRGELWKEKEVRDVVDGDWLMSVTSVSFLTR